MTALFSPLSLGSVELSNRIVIAPMCTYSAHEGCATDWHLMHYGQLAQSGAGLLIVESTAVEAMGCISPWDLGLWSDASEAAMRPVVEHVRRFSDIKLGVQLNHAGRKASSLQPWAGGGPLPPDQGWPTLGPSALPAAPEVPAPAAATLADIERIKKAFVDAALRAQRLGYDLIELHAAHKADHVYMLEEQGRPGELMPIMEDEHGTYIMNSKDLRAIEHIDRLTKIGVDSLKIEGRTKSLYYVSRTAQTYRRAIDDAVAGRPFNPNLITELEGLANRGYTSGFLERRPAQDYQNYETGHSLLQRSHFVGEVRGFADGLAEIETKNRFSVGDTLEIIHPSGNRQVLLEKMFNMDGEAVTVAQGNPIRVRIPLEGPVDGALIARLL